jgi:hypothetical protein
MHSLKAVIMKLFLLLIVLVLASGCGDTGYVPSYIISHTSEEQPVEEQSDQQPSEIPR